MAIHCLGEILSLRRTAASKIVTRPNNDALIDAKTGNSSLPELITKPWAMASSNAIKAKILHSDKSGTIGIVMYLAIKIKAIRAETRFGSKSAYWSLKFEAYCPRAKLEAKLKLDAIAQKIADFLFDSDPWFSSLEAATYPAEMTIIITAPKCI